MKGQLYHVAAVVAFLSTTGLGAASAQTRSPDLFTLTSTAGASSIGASVTDLGPDDVAKDASASGVRIQSVDADGAAMRAGLKSGDIVLEFDGERVRSARQFVRLVQESPSDRAVRTTVLRDGSKQTLTITPDSRSAANAFTFQPRVTQQLPALRSLPVEPLKVLPVPFATPPQLGVSFIDIDDQLATYFGVKDGVLITNVIAGSAAATAGLKAGDVVTAVNGRMVDSGGAFTSAVRSAQPGGSVEVRVMRDKKETTVKATMPGAASGERRRVVQPRTGARGV